MICLKLLVEKSRFLKSWQLAERSVGQKSTISVLSGVKCIAAEDRTTFMATDLKTSVSCNAEGVKVLEPGEAVFPVKVVGELFKKAPSKSFEISVEQGKARIEAGKSLYSFTTYPVSEFPSLPVARDASPFFTAENAELMRILEEGTFAGSPGEEFPQYLSAGLLQKEESYMRMVATDGRRLSLSRGVIEADGEDEQVLLPLGGLRELHRALTSMEPNDEVKVYRDESQAYFRIQEMEFSVRRVESRFPSYEKILNSDHTTWMTVDRESFMEALDRADVVVRDFSRMVVFTLSPGGNCILNARAPEIGESSEEMEATIDGEPLKIAFNVRYLLEGLKALHGKNAHLSFNGPNGQMTLSRPGEESFMYVLMPITLPEEEPAAEETE